MSTKIGASVKISMHMSNVDRDHRITRRCRVDDLHFPGDSVGRAQDHLEHPVVLDFYERRLQEPIGQETFRCAVEQTDEAIYTLHAAGGRGATWHDLSDGDDNLPPLDIVWLLAWRADHNYDAMCDLARDGVLLPEEADYQTWLDEDAYTFAKAMVLEVPALLLEAEQRKGEVIEGILAKRIPVRLYRDPDDGAPLLTVAIRTYPMPGSLELNKEWFERIVVAFFVKYPADLSLADSIGDEGLLSGEMAYCDFPPATP